MSAYWFAFLDGDILGPLTPAQLQVLVERGVIDAYTPVKHDRMPRYVPAFEVVGLLPPADAASTPRPEPGRHGSAEPRDRRRLLLLVFALLGWACSLLVALA